MAPPRMIWDPASTRPSGATSTTPPVSERTQTLSDAFGAAFAELGVVDAYGLVGGAVAPFCDALARSPIRVMHFRHEAGAAFAAVEAYFVSGRPGFVFSTTGPGITNALTGLAAARAEGAKVILVSGATSAPHRGRGAFQETSGYSMPLSGLFTAGPLFNFAATIEDPAEIAVVMRRIAAGLQQPGGFVAHVSIPIGLQTARLSEPFHLTQMSAAPLSVGATSVEPYARLLSSEPFAIWVGFGARNAAPLVRALAERTGAPVMSTPRGKGIFPEDHPQYLGVTGFAGHAKVKSFMNEHRPARLLVLGTRLGEFSSFWDPDLVPSHGLIHVDIDPEVPGAAYPFAKTVAVRAEIGNFLEALLEYFPPPEGGTSAQGRRKLSRAELVPREGDGPVRPRLLMEAIQSVVVKGHPSCVVLTEAGNSFAWGNNELRFTEPARYRTSMSFGSMGHAVTGVVGAALASGDKAVAIAGDGAMLMNNEISTAVRYGAKAVWIVLNDSRYGMIEQGMRAQGFTPVETAIPGADFAMIARAQGAEGIRVEREDEVRGALERAMAAEGPVVVDVQIDPDEVAPFNARIKSLIEQGAEGPGGVET